ncbi:hypothetical protein [Persephonella sp. IF05-L8]|uniref:hypothetical protein n=1 Tax=Persephonella sp. IF05-L8 TaxID=1158338 RepID=UPI00049513E9
MKRVLFAFLSITLIAFAQSKQEINQVCDTYVSILDECDMDNVDCEKTGEILEKFLLSKNVKPEVAKHFHQQCVKVCLLPKGKYQQIREDIKQACMKGLEE